MSDNKSTSVRKPVKKKSGKVWKIILTFLLIILLAIGSYLVYLYFVGKSAADKAYDDSGRVKSDLREEQVTPFKDNVSILFVGVDDSEKRGQGENNSRSDSLMLATLNNKDHSVKLLSIPRDSYVTIPAFGYDDKITHAHTAPTGVQSTIETVEKMLDVPVDYYFELNFDSFIEIVDALDGIEVDVPYDLHELDENDKRTVNLKKGVQVVNGREALALARTRHQDNDFKRGERQQMILKAIAAKATSVSSFTKYDSLLTAIGDNMTTNMTFKQMKSFFSYLQDGMPSMESLKLEGSDDMSTGVYYFKINDESLLSTSQTLQKQLELPQTSDLTPADPENPNAATDTTTDQQ
ncbi:LCP family protein [Kurthia sibirica]|uniref:Transcriptional regulator n=1 Tax=Kurthia sibirica TaxID=202750 RepID=A0A2U3AMP5_9BACL|nr:LCP family protein [Kurthia sibirica]PWI25779.1 transcriptional regulator [Kurthia sibirica]GEK35107.1 LytR family transcriptional regulator [Kurthia sibirica]